MSVVRPFSRAAVAHAGTPSRPCGRLFTSSSRRADEPKRGGVFSDLLDSMQATAERSRMRSPMSLTPNTPLGLGNTRNDTSRLLEQTAKDLRKNKSKDEEQMAAIQETLDFERQMIRRWKDGDVYAPHDLSGVEMSKWNKGIPKGRPKKDVLDMLKVNPLDHYWNFSIMSEFMSETGRIKHSKDTGLRPVNQRKMAKALRRAIGLGLMPSVHKHPEILQPRGTIGR